MECLVILCITGLCLCHVVYAQAVIQCAYTLDGWNKASVSLQYQKPKYYHCLTDEFGHFIQKCSQRILVPKGMCPKFNSDSGQMDVFECQSHQNGCPPTHFWSNDAYNCRSRKRYHIGSSCYLCHHFNRRDDNVAKANTRIM